MAHDWIAVRGARVAVIWGKIFCEPNTLQPALLGIERPIILGQSFGGTNM